MKKLLVLSVVAIATFAFSSCTPKDCVCTATATDPDFQDIASAANITVDGKTLKEAGYKNCSDYYEKNIKPQTYTGFTMECVEE
ncbi:MAG: hypothetical protein IKP45_08575 [Bacteroidales bacterium]|nr:hypothetical protein [Bacteroidales bacterium]